jgi:hypothetical protein
MRASESRERIPAEKRFEMGISNQRDGNLESAALLTRATQGQTILFGVLLNRVVRPLPDASIA